MKLKETSLSTPTPFPARCKQAGWRHQFGHPTGFKGWVVGYLMPVKNKERSLWVLSLLNLQQSDHVLEIGFGSGADIQRVSRTTVDGFVAGIDHSDVMLRHARRRNVLAIRTGKVDLRQTSVSHVPYADESFDKVFSINSAQFWTNLPESLKELRRVLKPGGLVAIAVQPRSRGANEQTANQTGKDLINGLVSAGFRQVRLGTKPMKPVSVVCALGIR